MWTTWPQHEIDTEGQIVGVHHRHHYCCQREESMSSSLERGPVTYHRWRLLKGYRFCYGPTPGTTHLMDLTNFSPFILSYLIISDFKPWGDSLWELTYLTPFTISQNTYLPHGEPCSIKLNFILAVHFHAVHGYAATHMHATHVYASLPFCHCHAVASCL